MIRFGICGRSCSSNVSTFAGGMRFHATSKRTQLYEKIENVDSDGLVDNEYAQLLTLAFSDDI